MVAKKYTPQESEALQLNEPMAAYQRISSVDANLYVVSEYEREIISRSEKDYEEGRIYTQDAVDKMVEQWLS